MDALISLLNPLTFIPLALTVALKIVYSITSGLLIIPISFLNWTANNSISITHQPVVTMGWQICRDLVNIGLVLALIVVAIGMILKINEYGSWKLLFGLIIVAILVNFTPVICGLVIDLANITMNVFKQPAIDNLTEATNSFNGMKSLFSSSSSIGVLLAGIILDVIVFFVFFIYALIFLIRIPVLWVLVIISPFALLGYFYPFARSIWMEWKKQFFQWTIIGIPLFFFLYLAGLIYKNPVCEATSPTGATLADWMNGPALCGLLSILFPVFFLIIGLGAAFTFKLPKEMGDLAKKGEAGSKQWLNRARTSTGTAIRDTAPITKAEGSIRRRLEGSTIGKAFGIKEGDFDLYQKRRMNEAGKGLEDASTDTLRKTAKGGIFTSPYRRAKALDLMLKKNKITEGERKHIEKTTPYGFSEKAVYDAIPSWEGRPKIRERVEGLDSEEFRKSINTLAFETPGTPATATVAAGSPTYSDEQLEVFYSMDMSKVLELEKGSKNKRKALYRLVVNKQADIFNEIFRLGASPSLEDQARANNIDDMLMHIGSSPNYIR